MVVVRKLKFPNNSIAYVTRAIVVMRVADSVISSLRHVVLRFIIVCVLRWKFGIFLILPINTFIFCPPFPCGIWFFTFYRLLKVDITLDGEKTLVEVLAGISRYLESAGFCASAVEVDGAPVKSSTR
jgi:hypothetical protein